MQRPIRLSIARLEGDGCFGCRDGFRRTAFASEHASQLCVNLRRLRHERDGAAQGGDRLRHFPIVLETPALQKEKVGFADRIGWLGGSWCLEEDGADEDKRC